jgi:hypothetical protein
MSTEEIRLSAIQSVPIAIGAIYLLTDTKSVLWIAANASRLRHASAYDRRY